MSELKVYGIGLGTGAVTGLTATPGAQQVTLDWNDTAGATGYKVFRRNPDGTTYPSTPTASPTLSTYVDTGRADGTQYCYKVAAVSGAGDGQLSGEQCATTPGVSPTPTSTATCARRPRRPPATTATATATGPRRPGGGGGGAAEAAAEPRRRPRRRGPTRPPRPPRAPTDARPAATTRR